MDAQLRRQTQQEVGAEPEGGGLVSRSALASALEDAVHWELWEGVSHLRHAHNREIAVRVAPAFDLVHLARGVRRVKNVP
jgi:hypothetical protein